MVLCSLIIHFKQEVGVFFGFDFSVAFDRDRSEECSALSPESLNLLQSNCISVIARCETLHHHGTPRLISLRSTHQII
jgi:hypothetical protein